jgi:hypothetical protein
MPLPDVLRDNAPVPNGALDCPPEYAYADVGRLVGARGAVSKNPLDVRCPAPSGPDPPTLDEGGPLVDDLPAVSIVVEVFLSAPGAMSVPVRGGPGEAAFSSAGGAWVLRHIPPGWIVDPNPGAPALPVSASVSELFNVGPHELAPPFPGVFPPAVQRDADWGCADCPLVVFEFVVAVVELLFPLSAGAD